MLNNTALISFTVHAVAMNDSAKYPCLLKEMAKLQSVSGSQSR